MLHRGPDDSGVFIGRSSALGFRRLAILDLSSEANQPIQLGDAVASVFNGEIYNYPALRKELIQDGVTLRTDCDAEVIPHLYLRHGPSFVERLQGMFAIALVDLREHRLLLARDRFGKKPLYYRTIGPRVEFASEPKALLTGGSAVEADHGALVRFLACGYVPGTGSAFGDLARVPPGGLVTVDSAGVKVEQYYTPPQPSVVERSIDEWKELLF